MDLRSQAPQKTVSQLKAIRQRMSHQVLVLDQWPLFEIQATQVENHRTRLHFSIDGLIADGRSIFLLFQEWAEYYRHPEAALTPLALSFRDYVLSEIALQETEVFQSDLDYWQNRLSTLPPAPELPLAKKPSTLTHPQFVRQSARLEPETWLRLKHRASAFNITPSGILLAAYAQVLATWSNLHFTLNVTLSNRLPFHPQVNELVGVFSSVNLLEVEAGLPGNFQAYYRLLLELADNDSSWQETKQLLPPAQLEQRLAINSTEVPVPDELLQTLFTSQVSQRRAQVAVVSANRNLTYTELERHSNQVNTLGANIQIVSVGGPTETTLWNICYSIEAVDPAWKSIPYGKPIANTRRDTMC